MIGWIPGCAGILTPSKPYGGPPAVPAGAASRMFGATAACACITGTTRVFGLAPLAVLERLNARVVHACVTSPVG